MIDRTEYMAKYHREHRDEEKAYRTKYRLEHLERVKARSAKYYAKWYQKNRAKKLASVAKYRQEHPLEAKASQLRYNFNLTLGEYDQMLAAQNGLCAICEKPPKNRALAVDHDHATGRIRGLLCANCNSQVVSIVENFELIEKARKYLRETMI